MMRRRSFLDIRGVAVVDEPALGALSEVMLLILETQSKSTSTSTSVVVGGETTGEGVGVDADAVVDWRLSHDVEVARAAREENGRGWKGVTICNGCCIDEGACVAAHMATAWSSMARR